MSLYEGPHRTAGLPEGGNGSLVVVFCVILYVPKIENGGLEFSLLLYINVDRFERQLGLCIDYCVSCNIICYMDRLSASTVYRSLWALFAPYARWINSSSILYCISTPLPYRFGPKG